MLSHTFVILFKATFFSLCIFLSASAVLVQNSYYLWKRKILSLLKTLNQPLQSNNVHLFIFD